MEAEVIVIGPFAVLSKAGVLDYHEEHYYDAKPNDTVMGTIVRAVTDRESETLATICGVQPYDLLHHQVRKPHLGELVGERVAGYMATMIYDRLRMLLEDGRCLIWFRPNM